MVLVALGLSAWSCNGPIVPREPSPNTGPQSFSSTVEVAERGSIATGSVSPNAQTLRVGCVSCHSLREGASLPESASDLVDFHQGLHVEHGTLRCASCHNPANVVSFRLADGEVLASARVFDLCSQCHGPQRRDYDHGAHGGMIGHWDLSRGPRSRKVCTDCHDPHAPTYIGGLPVPPPRDRFLKGDNQ